MQNSKTPQSTQYWNILNGKKKEEKLKRRTVKCTNFVEHMLKSEQKKVKIETMVGDILKEEEKNEKER